MAEPTSAPAIASSDPVAEQGIKLFVGNLAYAVDDQALQAFFEPLKDDIISAQVILRGPRSAGYGFVSVNTQEAADRAVQELNGQELHSRNVVIEVAKPKEQKNAEKREKRAKRKSAGRRGDKAVVGEVTEAEASGEAPTAGVPLIARIDDAETGVNGEVTTRKPRKKKSSKKRKSKTAPRTDGNDDAAADWVAPAGDNANISGETGTTVEQNPGKRRGGRRPFQRRYPRAPRRPAGETPEGEPSETVLFVANLAFSVDEELLTQLFLDNGINVSSARVVRRKWGMPRRSKGYGFVDVGDQAEQQKALLALQGKSLNDREITVKVAVDSPRHRNGGGDDGAPADVEAPVAGTLPVVPVA